jgi:hypothetical protein
MLVNWCRYREQLLAVDTFPQNEAWSSEIRDTPAYAAVCTCVLAAVSIGSISVPLLMVRVRLAGGPLNSTWYCLHDDYH